jgi:hypothetical protein
MAVVFGRNEIGIERTGVRVTVASNDTAKLMYYLSCVCNTIECNQDEDIRRFTDYRNWTRLSNEEQKLLVILCYTFSPDVFDDKVFFRSDALCGDLGNQFYTINQVRQQLVAVQSIIIAGRSHQVSKIMTYKMSWMQDYYLEPMKRQAQRLAAEPTRRQLPPPTQRQYRPQPVRAVPTANSDCCCTIL